MAKANFVIFWGIVKFCAFGLRHLQTEQQERNVRNRCFQLKTCRCTTKYPEVLVNFSC